MISIIVCSNNPIEYSRLSISISKSIGVPFQILKIENQIEQFSLAKAYNKGGSEAEFDYLVFVHEDVIFHTYNWGQILINQFISLYKPGILGVAGSTYLPLSPSSWWISDPSKRIFNYLDNGKEKDIGSGIHRNSGALFPQKVYLLDGMFLAIKREVFQKVNFDEGLQGFHGYDTSICLRSAKNYQNYFIPDILIEHFSYGNPDKNWLLNTIEAYDSYVFLKHNFKKEKNLEIKSYHLFLNQLRKFAPNSSFQFQQSAIYLKRIIKEFLSIRALCLWIVFQIRFLRDLITHRKLRF